MSRLLQVGDYACSLLNRKLSVGLTGISQHCIDTLDPVQTSPAYLAHHWLTPSRLSLVFLLVVARCIKYALSPSACSVSLLKAFTLRSQQQLHQV